MNYPKLAKLTAFALLFAVLFLFTPSVSFASDTGTVDLFTTYSFIIMCVCVIATSFILRIVISLRKTGKPGLVAQKTVTMPPEGVFPAEIGYILRHYTDERDIASIFVQWMCSGAVEVENGSGLDDTYIVKNKLGEKTPRYQILIYNEIFRYTDRIALSSITAAYPNIVKDTKKRIAVKYDEKHTEVFSKTMMILKDALLCAASFPVTLLMGLYAYNSLKDPRLSALIAGAIFFAAYFLSALILKAALFDNAQKNAATERQSENYKKLRNNTLLIWIIGTAVFYLTIFLICLPVLNYGYLSVLALAANIATVYIASKFKSRSELGLTLESELKALKKFMRNPAAHIKKARWRFKAIPDYFYRMLPYAYALGVSDYWFDIKSYAGGKFLSPYKNHIGKQQYSAIFNELTDMFINSLTIRAPRIKATPHK